MEHHPGHAEAKFGGIGARGAVGVGPWVSCPCQE